MLEESNLGSHRSGPWELVITEATVSDDSSAGGTSSEEEDEIRKIDILRLVDRPSEYWHIQKLIKYIKTGNQTATMISLCCLKDHDLTNEINQIAIQDINGLEVLVNLLETNDLDCKLGVLSVLLELTTNVTVQRRITDMGGVLSLIDNISDPARDIQILAAENLANLSRTRRARRIIRTSNSIPILVDLIDIEEKFLRTPWERLNTNGQEIVNIAKAGAKALWSCSRSKKIRNVMQKSGIIYILAKLLRSVHLEVVIPTVGIIEECANNPVYQLAFQTQNMIPYIVRHLSTVQSQKLRCYCAAAIFKFTVDAASRKMVKQAGGLDSLITIAKDISLRDDKQLLAAVTGALWKCAASKESMRRLNELRTVETLVSLLQDPNAEVLTNAVGALSECVKFEDNRSTVRVAGGLPLLINLLNHTWRPLLENVPLVLRECALEPDCMEIIEEYDGVRLIWSLLKNTSNAVKTNAILALVPCVDNASDSGEMVRSFVGGLELIVNLLKSDDVHVLAAVCAALAVISKDRENLAVITDHGLIPMLVNLVHTKDELLRENLAQAIAYSCSWGTNCKDLGQLGAITPLVEYMAESNSPSVLRTTSLALYHLSKNAFNCITLHESGVVPFLLRAISTQDQKLQNAAAGCLTNIRKYALEAETYHLVDKGFKGDDESDDS